jgi:hypothetical protein
MCYKVDDVSIDVCSRREKKKLDKERESDKRGEFLVEGMKISACFMDIEGSPSCMRLHYCVPRKLSNLSIVPKI